MEVLQEVEYKNDNPLQIKFTWLLFDTRVSIMKNLCTGSLREDWNKKIKVSKLMVQKLPLQTENN